MSARRTTQRATGLLALAAVAAACAGRVPEPRAPPAGDPPPVADLDARVLLIGDAGGASAADPVLRALHRELAEAPERTLVVFLGDNVYPRGMGLPGDPRRPQDEQRLESQLAAVR